MKPTKKSDITRIYTADKAKLNSIQMILSFQRGELISKVEILHLVLEEVLNRLIDEYEKKREMREHKMAE